MCFEYSSPSKLVELQKNASTEFAKYFDAMESIFPMYGTDFWQMNESHDMKTENGLFRNLDFVLSEPLHNLQSNAWKGKSEHGVATWEGIKDLVELCLYVMAVGPGSQIWCFAADLDGTRCWWLKRMKVQAARR